MARETRVLLVDANDPRRLTLEKILLRAGYEVECRDGYKVAESVNHEPTYDLLILALRYPNSSQTAAYSERLRRSTPALPILLLVDTDVFVSRETMSRTCEAGSPEELMSTIREMLAHSTHTRTPHSDGNAGR